MRGVLIYALTLLLSVPIHALANDASPQTLPSLHQSLPAPDFTLQGEDGETYRLSDYRGQVVVLNFWATWCPPCRDEMPSMERAWQQVRDDGIVFLGINVGEDADTIFEFTGTYPMSFPLLMDRAGAVVKAYPVVGLPTTYIVNPAGKVTHRAVGGREWDDPQLLDLLRQMQGRN